jgi:hypothetical protein
MNALSETSTYILEGVVEEDPLTGLCTIRTEDEQGNPFNFDPQVGLKTLKGREVRLVLVPLATIEQIQRLEQAARESEGPC